MVQLETFHGPSMFYHNDDAITGAARDILLSRCAELSPIVARPSLQTIKHSRQSPRPLRSLVRVLASSIGVPTNWDSAPGHKLEQ